MHDKGCHQVPLCDKASLRFCHLLGCSRGLKGGVGTEAVIDRSERESRKAGVRAHIDARAVVLRAIGYAAILGSLYQRCSVVALWRPLSTESTFLCVCAAFDKRPGRHPRV